MCGWCGWCVCVCLCVCVCVCVFECCCVVVVLFCCVAVLLCCVVLGVCVVCVLCVWCVCVVFCVLLSLLVVWCVVCLCCFCHDIQKESVYPQLLRTNCAIAVPSHLGVATPGDSSTPNPRALTGVGARGSKKSTRAKKNRTLNMLKRYRRLVEQCTDFQVHSLCLSLCLSVCVVNASVCTSTTPACDNTCGRGAGTHGDVSNVHKGTFRMHTRRRKGRGKSGSSPVLLTKICPRKVVS